MKELGELLKEVLKMSKKSGTKKPVKSGKKTAGLPARNKSRGK